MTEIIYFDNKKKEILRTDFDLNNEFKEINFTLDLFYKKEVEPISRAHKYYDSLKLKKGVTPPSYADVLVDGLFKHRRYFRGGKLSPIKGYEVCVWCDLLLRQKQIATQPVLNFKKIMADGWNGTMLTNEQREISFDKFYNKYKV